jgi:tryptophanyl-tRNA synthetase
MAADILLYDAKFVPVGDDQRQHVELTRDVAERFNRLYGETFVVPEAVIAESGARIMGLEDPTQKMSKSDDLPGQGVAIFDDPAVIRRNIMRATTDSQREIRFDPSRPGIYNLLTIYEVITGESREAIEAGFEGKGYGDFKRAVADAVVGAIEPIQRRANELLSSGELEGMLRRGAERAAPVAEATLGRVKQKLGLA